MQTQGSVPPGDYVTWTCPITLERVESVLSWASQLSPTGRRVAGGDGGTDKRPGVTFWTLYPTKGA